jgi:hypothetical protein
MRDILRNIVSQDWSLLRAELAQHFKCTYFRVVCWTRAKRQDSASEFPSRRTPRTSGACASSATPNRSGVVARVSVDLQKLEVGHGGVKAFPCRGTFFGGIRVTRSDVRLHPNTESHRKWFRLKHTEQDFRLKCRQGGLHYRAYPHAPCEHRHHKLPRKVLRSQ